MRVNTDCRHFDGYKPCRPHKDSGVHCTDCPQYEPVKRRVAVLKLGAAGEVVRCTPILRYLREHLADAAVYWVTRFQELLPTSWVDGVLPWSWETAEWLKAQPWDLVLSLDKEPGPCAVARQMTCRTLKGFTLDDHGRVAPADDDARRKWATGVFDDLMLANRRHYVEELFEVCGWTYSGQRYVLPQPHTAGLDPMPGSGPLVGLNIGAGRAWRTRRWPAGHFAELIHELRARGIRVVLLGGPDEHDTNVELARMSGAFYHGVRPLQQFMSVVADCDVVVTSVTLALHLAIGLQRRIVLLNNIFNRHEFHLFGLGEILEPALPCLGCYKPRFDGGCPVPDCMAEIAVDSVCDAVLRQLEHLHAEGHSGAAVAAGVKT